MNPAQQTESDVSSRRGDFPIFDDSRLTYLDSAATAQKPRQVCEAMDSFYRSRNATVRRAAHSLAAAASAEYESARETVAGFIGAKADEIIFTKNATEAINLVALSWGRNNLQEGDSILLTEMEHHANLVPWYLLAKERKLKLRFAKIDTEGRLDRADFTRQLDGAKLAAFTHASNVLGTINPVAELIAEARAGGAKTLIDGAQAVPHFPVDVTAVDPDWYAFAGHKAYGPTGIGVLRVRPDAYAEMEPVFGGGEMIKEVGRGMVTFAEPPGKFEAGTPPVAEAIGLGAALEYVKELGMESVAKHDQELITYTQARLSSIPRLNILGPPEATGRVGLVSFDIEGVDPQDLSTLLDQDGVAVRAGNHCAQPLYKTLSLAGACRASFGVYTDRLDIDRLAESVERSLKTLK